MKSTETYSNQTSAIKAEQEAMDDMANISDAAHAAARLARQIRNKEQRRELARIIYALVKLKNRAEQRRKEAARHI